MKRGDAPEELMKSIAAMRKQLSQFRIIGGEGVTVHGSMQHGYAVSVERGGTGGGGAGGGGGGNGGGDCPDLTLVCDSISASKRKCGFFGYGPDFLTYKTRTWHYFYHNAVVSPACDGGATDFTVVDTVRSDCECDGLDDPDVQSAPFGFPNPDPPTSCYDRDITGSGAIGGQGCATCSTTISTSITETGKHKSMSCSDGNVSASYNEETDLSDEYTTAVLISDTEAALPAYSGFDGEHSELGQGTTCSANRNLSGDEVTYSIQQFKYKFTFTPIGTGFTIEWNEHTEFDDLSTSDTPMSEHIDAGFSESSVYEVLEPSTNGTTTITDIVCVPD